MECFDVKGHACPRVNTTEEMDPVLDKVLRRWCWRD